MRSSPASTEALATTLLELLAVAQGRLYSHVANASLERLGLRPTMRELHDASQILARDHHVSDRYGMYETVWHIVEGVCRALQRTPRYGELYRVLADVAPLRSFHHDEARVMRDLRWSMISGDVDAFRPLLRHASSVGLAPSLAFWALDPLDGVLLREAPGAIVGSVLAQLHANEWRELEDVAPLDELIDVALEREPDCPELQVIAARRAAIRGETDRVQSLVGAVDHEEALYLRGWAALAHGDVKGATKLYAKALSQHRKRVGRKLGIPGGQEGTFLGLAYLLDGTATRAKQAGGLCTVARQAYGERRWLASPYRALGDLHTSLQGGEVTDPPLIVAHPATVLLDALRAAWADEPLPDGVEGAIASASELGWTWLVGELKAAQGDPSDAPGIQHLVRHREKTSLWERRLAALEALAPGGREPAPVKTAPSHRIAWVLAHRHGHWIHLEARHQKLGRQGWSKGRPIALSRLRKDPGSIAGLTDDDRRVIAGLRSRTVTSWRGHRREQLEWSHDATWVALIDHPGVVNEAHEPVTVTEVRPRLVLKRTGPRLTLTLDPPMDTPVVVAEAQPDHYEVTAFDKVQAELAEQLGEGLEVPGSQAKRVGRLIERFTHTFEVHDEAAATDAQARPADPSPVLQLTPAGDGIQVRVIVRPLGPEGPELPPGRGARSILARIDGTLCRTQRDLADEAARASRLPEVLPGLGISEADDHVHLIDEAEAALEFLAAARAHPELVFEWPEGERFRVRSEVGPSRFQLSVTGADQWLQFRGSVQVDDDLVLSLVDVLGRLDGARGRFVELEDGSFIALTHSLQRRLDAVKRASRTVKGTPRVHRLASPLVEALIEEAGSVRRNKAARALFAAFAAPEPSTAPPTTLQAELRPYQVDGLRWLRRMTALGAGVCLADDMGLGKTLQVLAWLLTRVDEGPTLVVAPTSVCGSWVEQAWRFAPTLDVQRFGSGDRAKMVEEAGPGQILVTSYGLLQSESELLSARAWSTVVLDEAQAIKNPSTQRHQAAIGLTATHRIALTGTPLENHLGELWALFSFLNPGLLGTEKQFMRRFAGPIEAGQREVAAQLRHLVLPFLLRRTKSAVLQDLPPKTEIAIDVEPSPEEAAFYEALRQRALTDLQQEERATTMQILHKLTQLRQAACSPTLIAGPEAPHGAKLDAFRGVVTSLRANGHRALVFSQFVRHLTILRTWLDKAGIPYQYLDGSTPAKRRDQRVQAFQRGEGDLFLISLKAGGTGLTLTAADYVLHMDPWWNPAVEDQASDRAHRIGQTRPVTVYRFITKGTVEEQISALHATKRDLSEMLLSGTDAAARMSPEQLMALLQDAHSG